MHDVNSNGIDIARYIKVKDELDAVEFSITILDEYQNQGLGTKLLYKLIEAASINGIRKFIGFFLEENTAMIIILKKMWATKNRDEENILRIEVELSSDLLKPRIKNLKIIAF